MEKSGDNGVIVNGTVEPSRFSQLEIDGPNGAAHGDGAPIPSVVPQGPVPVPVVEPTAPATAPATATSMATGNIVAVDLPSEVTGCVLFWRLSGDVDLGQLIQAWGNKGLDSKLLPEVPSVRIAFSRAVKIVESRHRIVRKGPNGTVFVVDEVPTIVEGESQVELQVNYQYGVNPTTGVMFGILPKGSKGDQGQCEVMGGMIQVEFDRLRSSLATVDTSNWLVRLAGAMSGVPLRDRGGVYFIPREAVAQLRAVKAALTEAGAKHCLYEIPAMHSAEAVSAVLDAVTVEANDFMTEIENAVNSGDIGRKSAVTRGGELAELKSKVEAYSKLLGVSFTSVLGRIESVAKSLKSVATRGELLEID